MMGIPAFGQSKLLRSIRRNLSRDNPLGVGMGSASLADSDTQSVENLGLIEASWRSSRLDHSATDDAADRTRSDHDESHLCEASTPFEKFAAFASDSIG